MRTRWIRILFMLAVCVSVSVAAMADDPVTAFSVQGFGEYVNDVTVLIDRIIPPEETEYTAESCVHWNTADTCFIIDLGTVIQIEGITLQVDNNDDYQVDVSTDGKNYSPLLTVSGDWGEMTFGMETLSTLSGSSQYIPEAVFSPANGRYLRLSATGGDEAYAASEVQVFGGKAVQAEARAQATAKNEGLIKVFVSMDADRDGMVSLDEYVAVWNGKLDASRNFNFFDRDRNGYIERTEYLEEADSHPDILPRR